MLRATRFEDLKIGDEITFTRTLGEGECALFVAASGDFNPYHTDDGFARRHRFGKRIVPGLLTASLFTHIGGKLGFLATTMTFEYLAPVFIGDTVSIRVRIVSLDSTRKFLSIVGEAANQEGVVVLRAKADGYPTLE
jgi:3-hydroxybutyryl-CoA dehydratase